MADLGQISRSAGTGGERPDRTGANDLRFGSDVIAEPLRDLDIPYVALNPGASFRGLHDSLVNFLGNRDPQMLLCLHEEHAVAIAHGFAKVTGRAMAAAVHSNVGLMHATMAIFNAWCDRMPVLVLGATGPVDAGKRRPWIDWIHTAADQGALVRNYVKWDDQPASPVAAREALLRGVWQAQSSPKGPVYINFDAEVQEGELEKPLPSINVRRFVNPPVAGPDAATLEKLSDLFAKAVSPLMLVGRVSRDEAAWNQRIALAERLGARVISDLKVAAAFPTDHPAYVGDLRGRGGARALDELKRADLVIALDWVDLSGALTAAFGPTGPQGQVVRVGLDHRIHNGWSMDHQAHPVADHVIECTPEAFVSALGARLDAGAPDFRPAPPVVPEMPRAAGALGVEQIALATRRALDGAPACLTHVTLSWDGQFWPFQHPLDYLGSDGGGGIGAGPGHAVGAALALRDSGSDRLPIAICGDGDFLMGVTALWTAAHYDIPLLVIVANNRSFFNDEVHQERVARMRGRPVDNKWIGMRMSNPDIALTEMAHAQGCKAYGPIEDQDALVQALADAIDDVRAGHVAVVEVITDASYPPALIKALTPEQEQ